jgi:uncharacterized damage-inducible protein DinB
MKPQRKNIPEIAMLLRMLEEGFLRKGWYGTTLRGSIRGITAAEAARRPGKWRHNIHEIVVHCAYWKYAVLRKITGGKRGSFGEGGSNWFRRPAVTISELEWNRDVRRISDIHQQLMKAVSRVKASDLPRVPKGSRVTIGKILTGIAMHDVYHAGQIQLIKRIIR